MCDAFTDVSLKLVEALLLLSLGFVLFNSRVRLRPFSDLLKHPPGRLWWLISKESSYNAGAAGDTGLILGKEDPLEKDLATHSSILAWRIQWTEEPGGLQCMGSQMNWTRLRD